MLKKGDLLKGQYEIIEQIGKGGMSTVYKAKDRQLGGYWAVKEIKKMGFDSNNEQVEQRAIAEAKTLTELRHDALPFIKDMITENDEICIVMELIEGKSLDKIVDEFGPQDQKMVIEWGKQLASALAYLHDNKIIYRDMKPANVMLKSDGKVKIVDFGIAREYKENKSEDTIAIGTPGYAAPEQHKNLEVKTQSGPRTDIYSLGVTLYNLVTARNPAKELELKPIREINPALSSGLESIILKCTQTQPDDRYANCYELVYALENYEKEETAYKNQIRKKMNAFVATAISSVVCLVLGFICLFVNQVQIKNNYNTLVDQGEKATTLEESRDNYLKAIENVPTNSEAYIQLIQTYKNDTESPFNRNRSQELIEDIKGSLDIMKEKNKAEYGRVAYELGKLYWYYLDYEAPDTYDPNREVNYSELNTTSMSKAAPWFADAKEYLKDKKMAQTASKYEMVGSFYQDVIVKRNEGSSVKGMYREYFDNISALMTSVIEEDEEEIVQLEVERMVVNSVEAYVRDFARDGVGQDELLALFDRAIENANKAEGDTEKKKKIKESILDREEERKQNISNGYVEGR